MNNKSSIKDIKRISNKCINSEDIKYIDSIVFMHKTKKDDIIPIEIENYLVDGACCSGLYMYSYTLKNNTDLVYILPFLKFDNKYEFHQSDNDIHNESVLDRFKEVSQNIFSSQELSEIERRFIIGGIVSTTH